VTYTYDTGPFGKGRLTGIARHGETLAYTHDCFGRLLQDGTLAYEFDCNGNRTKITHPDSVTATCATPGSVDTGAWFRPRS
jgi:hypothetical protein